MLKVTVIESHGKSQIFLKNTETNDMVPITDLKERKENAKQDALEALSNLLLRVSVL